MREISLPADDLLIFSGRTPWSKLVLKRAFCSNCSKNLFLLFVGALRRC